MKYGYVYQTMYGNMDDKLIDIVLGNNNKEIEQYAFNSFFGTGIEYYVNYSMVSWKEYLKRISPKTEKQTDDNRPKQFIELDKKPTIFEKINAKKPKKQKIENNKQSKNNLWIIALKTKTELKLIDIVYENYEKDVYTMVKTNEKFVNLKKANEKSAFIVLPKYDDMTKAENILDMSKRAKQSYVKWEIRNDFAYENMFASDSEDMESTATLSILEYFNGKETTTSNILQCWTETRKALQNYRNNQRKHNNDGTEQLEKISIGMYGINRYDKPLPELYEQYIEKLKLDQKTAVDRLILTDTPNVQAICDDMSNDDRNVSRASLYRFAYRGLFNICREMLHDLDKQLYRELFNKENKENSRKNQTKETINANTILFMLELRTAMDKLKKKIG